MNKEIHCITNEGKSAKNEWENDLCSLYEKIRTTLFPYLLINLISVLFKIINI